MVQSRDRRHDMTQASPEASGSYEHWAGSLYPHILLSAIKNASLIALTMDVWIDICKTNGLLNRSGISVGLQN